MTNTSGMPADVQKRMEEIIARHAEAYRRDLPGLVDNLSMLAKDLRDGREPQAALAALEREAHDMKGQAATFGLPGIAALANSLCQVVTSGPVLGSAAARVIDSHISGLQQLLNHDDPVLVERVIAQAHALKGSG